jgi:hypothetical protein
LERACIQFMVKKQLIALEEHAAPLFITKIHNPATFNRPKGMQCRERLNACKEYRKSPDG